MAPAKKSTAKKSTRSSSSNKGPMGRGGANTTGTGRAKKATAARKGPGRPAGAAKKQSTTASSRAKSRA